MWDLFGVFLLLVCGFCLAFVCFFVCLFVFALNSLSCLPVNNKERDDTVIVHMN